jgi:hypothetical protein
MTLLTRWLADVPLLHLDAWQLDDIAAQLTLQVTSTQTLVYCPACQFPTRRIHSRYGFLATFGDSGWVEGLTTLSSPQESRENRAVTGGTFLHFSRRGAHTLDFTKCAQEPILPANEPCHEPTIIETEPNGMKLTAERVLDQLLT